MGKSSEDDRVRRAGSIKQEQKRALTFKGSSRKEEQTKEIEYKEYILRASKGN